MKVIIKAVKEYAKKPRKGWWGFEKDEYRYLMRYGHPILIWNTETLKIVHDESCTRTDIAGVNFAKKYLSLIE